MTKTQNQSSKGALFSLFFASLIALVSIVHMLFITFDTRLLVEHDGYYLISWVNQHSLGTVPFINSWLTGNVSYPLVNFLLCVLSDIGLMAPLVFRLVPALFFLMGLPAIFRIGSEPGSKKTGFMAAFVVATMPVMLNVSRQYFLQNFPVVFLLWEIVLLIRLHRSWSTRSAFLFGLLSALANLTHPIALLQQLPLYLIFVTIALRPVLETSGKKSKNAAVASLAIFIGLIVLVPTSSKLLSYGAANSKLISAWGGQGSGEILERALFFFKTFVIFPGLGIFLLFIPAFWIIGKSLSSAMTRTDKAWLGTILYQLGLTFYFALNGVPMIGFVFTHILLVIFVCSKMGEIILTKATLQTPIFSKIISLWIGLILIVGIVQCQRLSTLDSRSYHNLLSFNERLFVFQDQTPENEFLDFISERDGNPKIAVTENLLMPFDTGIQITPILGQPPSLTALRTAAAVRGIQIIKDKNPEKSLERFDLFYMSTDQSSTFVLWRKIFDFLGKFQFDTETESIRIFISDSPNLVETFLNKKSNFVGIVRKFQKPIYPVSQYEGQDIGKLREAAKQTAEAGDFSKASSMFEYILKYNPEDWEIRKFYAVAAHRKGATDQAVELWESLFAETGDFGNQLDGLRSLAQLAYDGAAPASLYDHYWNILKIRHEKNRQNSYMLLSAKVLERKIHRDWGGALLAIANLETILAPEQKPGVRLEKAQVLWEIGRKTQAILLLEQNMKSIKKTKRLYGDCAQRLSLYYAMQTNLEMSEKWFREVLGAPFDENALALLCIGLSTELVQQNEKVRAEKILQESLSVLHRNPKALVLVEIAKLRLSAGNPAEAKTMFEEALTLTSDPVMIHWITDIHSQIN